mmetsp:Transcript_4472/g.7871  ORF Transcript_4472/g.7871 Transcript_4472/m.7871 type:complete len:253 (-) Transcript_4472:529-1287(-)
MAALELINTLTLTFIATEVLFWKEARSERADGVWAKVLPSKRLKVAFAALLILNGLVFAEHVVADAVNVFLHIPWNSFQQLGAKTLTGLLTCLVCGTAAFTVVDKYNLRQGQGVMFARFAFAALAVVWFCIGYGAASVAGFQEASELAKIICAILGFTAVFYFDARRYTPHSGFSQLLGVILSSVLYTLPMVPFVAVLISTAFLVIVGVVENILHLDPSFLNWPVYFGTLYGPFVVVYVQSKKAVLMSPLLP